MVVSPVSVSTSPFTLTGDSIGLTPDKVVDLTSADVVDLTVSDLADNSNLEADIPGPPPLVRSVPRKRKADLADALASKARAV